MNSAIKKKKYVPKNDKALSRSKSPRPNKQITVLSSGSRNPYLERRALLIDDREVGSDSLDASQNSSSANEVTQCA